MRDPSRLLDRRVPAFLSIVCRCLLLFCLYPSAGFGSILDCLTYLPNVGRPAQLSSAAKRVLELANNLRGELTAQEKGEVFRAMVALLDFRVDSPLLTRVNDELRFGNQELKHSYVDLMVQLFRTYQKNPHLIGTSNKALFFHGGTSASLLWLTPHGSRTGGLIASGAMEKEFGMVPFGGEQELGRVTGDLGQGINQTHLSAAFGTDLNRALRYATLPSEKEGWSPERSPERLKKFEEMSQGTLQPIVENQKSLERRRLEQWSRLNSEERDLVQSGFPVLYGIRTEKIDPRLSPRLGEISIPRGVSADDGQIKVIYVPRNRIPLIRRLVAQRGLSDKVEVAEIEPLLSK